MTAYIIRDDAIAAEIIEPIEATRLISAREYDIEGIASQIIVATRNGYALHPDLDEEDFWEVVASHVIEPD